VILDTHPESDQHQNWTCSRGSPPAPTHQIWWWSMNRFLRYLVDKNSAHTQTDRHTPLTTRPCGLRRAGNKLSIHKNGPNKQQHAKKNNTKRKLTEPDLVTFYDIHAKKWSRSILTTQEPARDYWDLCTLCQTTLHFCSSRKH